MDIDSPTEDLLKNEEKESWKRLLDMIHRGNINEAENLVYEMTSNGDMSNLKIALLFYSCLNDKDDNFLMEHGFEREEIKFDNCCAASCTPLTQMYLKPSWLQIG